MKRNTLIAIAAAGAVIAGGTIGGVALASGSGGGEQELRGTEQAAAAVEFALEGLYLTRRLAKDTDGTRTIYGA